MRPTKLTMRAFECYAEETVIDFTEFDSGLYLIVGKTGSGKTTIFDAISFALYGVPSGSDRTPNMLHSDFVPLSRDTFVELKFTHQGRDYTVQRTIRFQRKRGTNEYGSSKIDAIFSCEGTPGVIKGASRVTAKCVSLLGLDANQFRRIAMLVQGEFRKFLAANSSEKTDILRRVFDNSDYLDYQNLLDKARKLLEERRAGYTQEIQVATDGLIVPMEASLPEDYLPGHPNLVGNLQALRDADEARLELLHGESVARTQEVESLVRREESTRLFNALLADLGDKREALGKMEEQDELVSMRESEYALAERALHGVRPFQERLRQLEDALRQTQAGIKESTSLLAENNRLVAEAQEAMEGDAEAKEQVLGMTATINMLVASLPRYDELAKQEETLSADRQRLEEATKRLTELEGQRDAMATETGDLRRQLDTLEGSEAQVERLRHERDRAKEDLDTIADPEHGVMAKVEAIKCGMGILEVADNDIKHLAADVSNAESRHHGLYQRFLEGQAGLIAVSMEEELSGTGHTICPVCNSEFHADEPHRFSIPPKDVPSQRKVEQAEKAWKKADERLREQVNARDKKRVYLEQQKETVIDQMRRRFPDYASWDMLSSSECLASLASQLGTVLSETEDSYSLAQSRLARHDEIRRRLQQKAEQLTSIEQEHKIGQDGVNELNMSISRTEATISQLRSGLDYDDGATAERTMAELEKKLERMQAEIDSHAKSLSDAQASRNEIEGSLKVLQGSLPSQEQAVADAMDGLAQALSDNGFNDIDAVRRALEPIGDGDGEQWLMRRRRDIDEHRHKVMSLHADIADLEQRTAGKVYTDLDDLSARLQVARQAQEDATKSESEQRRLLDEHSKVYEQVRQAKEALSETDEAWRRIDRLASLAVGTNSDTGRLSFDRYVMGAIFREVLDMANQRLNIMTGGRFELIHKIDADRKNGVAGLDVEVLDNETGRQRASGSISGGEGFLVSLSLALGLSDVVQSHAGGQKLDALFVDEGFGTLDDGKLDNVIAVLQQLAEGDRLVGVISHVDKLEESIPCKIRVSASQHGSTIVTELS